MKLVKHTYQIGDDVSYGFNGDWYSAGKVTKITKKYLTTERGRRFYLKEFTTSEYNHDTHEHVMITKEYFVSVGGGTWTLTKGVVEEQNPHF